MSLSLNPSASARLFPAESSFASVDDAGASALLRVENVTLQYRAEGSVVTAARHVSFTVDRSDRLVLLGPSGCGKSTLLKALGGFIRPAEGTITLRGRLVRGPGPDRMFVFQEFEQLLPWKTVLQNVVFVLTAAVGMGYQEAEARAALYLHKVGLTQFATAYPHMLSGGMKQRAAIARCLAASPEVILMDEPFAALDALTRERMQQELLRLWENSRFTMVFVTHSITEALRLGNRILLLSPHPGRVVGEIAVPPDLPDGSPEFLSLQNRIHAQLFRDESPGAERTGAGHP